MRDVVVRSSGFWVSEDPEDVITNNYFSDTLKLDTSDSWIVKNTGIRERHRSRIPTSEMAFKAAKICLERAGGVKPEEIDFIIVSTVTPDMLFPATATILQHKLGNKRAFSHDLNAGCSGWICALVEADALLRTGRYRYALVVASEKMTTLADYKDRGTCILFGDAAACVLLEAVDKAANPNRYGIQNFWLKSDGSGASVLYQPAGGSNKPPTHETVDAREHYLRMNGPEVYRHAVPKMVEACRAVLNPFGLKPNDMDLILPHQANERITVAVGYRLGANKEKVRSNIAHFGNTSSASIPLLLAQIDASGELTAGKRMLWVSFGAGWTWGSVYVVSGKP